MDEAIEQEFQGNWTLNCTCDVNNTLRAACNRTCDEPISQVSSEPPVYFTQEALVLFQMFYVIIMVVGIVGNALTIYVIGNHRKSMRRAIHLYTCNLAVTDLLILCFYVPTQMSMIEHQIEWKMGLSMCKLNYVVLPVALTSSIGTLLAITVDRFRGLVTPFSWRSDSQKHAKITVPLMWVVSFTLCTPLLIYPKLVDYQWSDTYTATYCSENWPTQKHSHWYWVTNFILLFAIPLVVIVTTQIIMLVTMSRELSTVNRLQNQRMIRMVIALVLVFTICTGFQHVFYFVMTFSDLEISGPAYAALYGSSNLVVSLQATLNPIIYGTLRQDFKKAFKSILVLILIKLKLHKKALNGKSGFASRVLSNYFSNADTSKQYSKKYGQVGLLFRKKHEAELSQTTSGDGSLQYYHSTTTPQSSLLKFHMNQSSGPPESLACMDSPRALTRQEYFFRKSSKSDVALITPTANVRHTADVSAYKRNPCTAKITSENSPQIVPTANVDDIVCSDAPQTTGSITPTTLTVNTNNSNSNITSINNRKNDNNNNSFRYRIGSSTSDVLQKEFGKIFSPELPLITDRLKGSKETIL